MENTTPIAPFDQPALCALCLTTFTSDNDPIDLDFITICSDCMFLLLEDNNNTTSNPISRTTPRLRRRTRYTARHNRRSATSSRTTPTGSRRFRRVVSVTESEGFDSVYEESAATYEAYDSDVSVEVRSFLGELLERLAEEDDPGRGPPPAALSFVNDLERVVVNDADHKGLACAICKDLLTVGNVVNRLPCLHLYHPSCIKPWLSNRNTCPMCRFEVPTDDVDYENRKQSVTSGSGVQDVEQRVEDTSFEEREGEQVLNSDDGRGRGAERWYYMAAQVVTLVGIGLALWLGNPGAIQGSSSVSGSSGSNQKRSRSRRL